ncbi:vWA domain-containing protein [Nocardioides piscis]|uniref:VWA domain-containing protein n=1 Tax=Nocardioides piscis TaxID=2714938 RepID=A0A6G7YDK1_9ACTN|nr:VWA domain-containing protein [Nocardioides piscis]QIK74687.1 VWA domain-containing protein [Nocardioides piscis]
MSLLDRHIGFLEALRSAGLSVSLAEGLDAIEALHHIGWDEREVVRTAYAATLVKKQSQRVTFDAIFDLYYPRLVGDGDRRRSEESLDRALQGDAEEPGVRDNGAALAAFTDELAEAMSGAEGGEQAELLDLAVEAIARFGAMPGRGPGLSSWSAYTALQRVAPHQLMSQLVAGLMADGLVEEDAERVATRRVDQFSRLVEAEARRRIAEEKGAEHVADIVVRPTIDRLDFTAARRADIAEMRREIYPLARRLATRLTKQQHARRRGALDFRRTVRASLSTGGVPLETHHRPKRPHRTELVVLCDVSGSVANFAQFTLLLVFALREQFHKVRAFTFVDQVHEVTHHFTPGGDVVEVMENLAASTAHAALWGRTNYGRAFTRFAEEHPDALGPKTSLLILGDARSNYSDLSLPVLRELAGSVKHAWWLNPEHPRHWGTGDSAAPSYGEIVPMVECRNLTQLEEFVSQISMGGTGRQPAR